MRPKRFTITEDHLKLLREANISWDGCEFGAPCIDPKRPYGNSDVIQDMARVLGIEPIEADFDERVYPKGTADKCIKLHREMETVLQIVLHTGEFKATTYECAAFGSDWYALRETVLEKP